MATISDYELKRRTLVALAISQLTVAMADFAADHMEMTALEWLKAIQTLESRMLAEGLADEWNEGAAK